ncbi:hypothetical protein [Aquamicrobium sp. LC103]|uniref:hypothetical protein n=1 Tax=Aquamicrobium sp. LC103 TaxID=1120658 RepID=UPI00109D7E5E|nr:hypothetical protein [Aquamicrobium sp. LC103]TKT69265.1 hypothetical protein XW59_028450 [Aquamicrobium sp. LC103]
MQNPAAYAHPERLAACFDRAISATACKTLLETKRLSTRLSHLIEKRYALGAERSAEEAIGEEDRRVALLPPDAMAEVAMRAGVTYWASAFAGAITGSEAAPLRREFGEELCAYALANKDLAGPKQELDPVDTARERIASDGWRCLAAWCHVVGPAAGTRFRLKLRPMALLDEVPSAALLEIGPQIIRRVAGQGRA